MLKFEGNRDMLVYAHGMILGLEFGTGNIVAQWRDIVTRLKDKF